MTQRTAKSYLYEGVVIVASILVAFGLDASWANYQESRVEDRVLGELRDELESAKFRITVSITEPETVISASLELAESLGSDTSALEPKTAQALFNNVLAINTLEVPSSVLDSIIASGQVRLISNGELRKALSEWPAFVSDVRENHEWHRAETDEFVVPHLANSMSVRDALISTGVIDISVGTFQYDVLKIQRDPEFEGRLLWRVWRQYATLDESRVLLAETENLLALIAAELD